MATAMWAMAPSIWLLVVSLLISSIVLLLILVVWIGIVHASRAGKAVLPIRGRGVVHLTIKLIRNEHQRVLNALTHIDLELLLPSRLSDCDMVNWLEVSHDRSCWEWTKMEVSHRSVVVWCRQMVFVALCAFHNFRDLDIDHPWSGFLCRQLLREFLRWACPVWQKADPFLVEVLLAAGS